MVAQHPLGSAPFALTAEKLERGSYGYHHAMLQVWFELRHEYLLLRRAQRHPHYIRPVGCEHTGDSRVVKIVDCAEWQLIEQHLPNVWIKSAELLAQSIEGCLVGTEESHAIAPLAHYVAEDVTATVLTIAPAIEQAQVERHIAAVADGEHATVDHTAISLIAVNRVEYHTVGHTDIVSSAAGYLVGNSVVDFGLVKFVSYVEVCIHFIICSG